MDAYGHVNNAKFLCLLEEARVHMFTHPDGGSMVRDGIVVVGARIDYLTPLVYREAPLPVEVWTAALGGADFELCYEIANGVSGDADRPRCVYARASTTMAAFDLAGGRPRRLTDEERALLEQWQDDPVVLRPRRERTP
jgi:acyl-CoA thioester hydrolase